MIDHDEEEHSPSSYGLDLKNEETEETIALGKWPVVPAIGDEIDLRDGRVFKVVGRTFSLDSSLVITLVGRPIKRG